MIYSFVVAFLVSLIVSPFAIALLRRFKFGQSIREEGPQSHQSKTGTPTIGGIIFLIGIVVAVCLFCPMSFNTILLLVLTVGYAAIGFLDDFIKVKLKRNLGLTAKQKLFAQLLLSIAVLVMLYKHGIDTHLYIQGLGINFDLKWLYYPFLFFLIIGTANSTNLTDGMDGLLSGTSIISFLAFAFISTKLGMNDVTAFSFSMIGGLLAFLLYNKYPAKVFMGDTGSLAIGGALVGIAIVTKTELFLAVIGALFVFETLSVILQVSSFKLRRKRIFRMSPIHHHFGEIGWSEKRVVYTFYLLATVFALAGMLIFNLH